MDASEFSKSFFDHLQKCSKSDSSAVGTLRRSLMFDPGTDSRAFPIVERQATRKSHRDRGTIYLAAGLWAQVVRQGQGRPMLFPDAMRRVRDKQRSDSIEKRFATLLDADLDELRWRLRSALTLVASQGIALAWPDLLDDMLNWHYSNRPVQTRWARHFWGQPEASA